MPELKNSARPAAWAILPERTWIEYDPDLGWRHQRGKEALLEKNGARIPLRTNSAGLRGGREYSPSNEDGKFRIYAAGDSFTFGFGVADEESFPAQLEAMDSRLEVLNMGVPGYGIDQIFLSLKRWGKSYAPDLVIVTVFPEDFWRATRAFNDAGYGKPYFVERNGKLKLKHVPVPKEMNFAVDQFPGTEDKGTIKHILSRSYLYRYGVKAWRRIMKMLNLEDPDTNPEWLIGRKILQEMKSYLASQEIPFLLVIAPPVRWITGTVEPLRDSILRFCSREEMDCVDLTPVFQQAAARASVDAYYIPDDYHWTRGGNRLAASAIFNRINAYLPAPEPAAPEISA